jgi:hypothetical protein
VEGRVASQRFEETSLDDLPIKRAAIMRAAIMDRARPDALLSD